MTIAEALAYLRRILAQSGPAVCLPMSRKQLEAIVALLEAIPQ